MRRNNWILVAIFIILAGALWVIRNKPEWLPASNEPTPTVQESEFVFNIATTDIAQIVITASDGRVTQIKRGVGGIWLVEKPTAGMADPSLTEAASSQVASILILDKLDQTPPDDVVGLDQPHFTITVGLQDSSEQALEIGAPTPTGNGYYARSGDKTVLIVPQYSIDALTNLLDNPPFPLPTETPAP